MVQILKNTRGTYVVMWADEAGLIRTRHFQCRFDAKEYACKLECRLELDAMLDELVRLGASSGRTLH